MGKKLKRWFYGWLEIFGRSGSMDRNGPLPEEILGFIDKSIDRMNANEFGVFMDEYKRLRQKYGLRGDIQGMVEGRGADKNEL